MDSHFTFPPSEKYVSKDRTFSVNFTCQRCCQPLKLHSSFRDLDSQTLSELTVPLHLPGADRDERGALAALMGRSDESSVMRKIVWPVRFADAGSDFMVVDDLSNLPIDSHQATTLRTTAALFDIMSDQSDVDHPLCEECTDNLLDQMDQQLRIAEDECKEYRDFLEQLEAAEEEEDVQRLKGEYSGLQAAEEELRQELARAQEAQREVRAALGRSEEECDHLQREEDQLWQEFCRVQRQLLTSEDGLCCVENQIAYTQGQLDKLSKTNVFNTTFHIWHSGHFGTINGFRLGRLANVPVEWPEINAAWGQTVLLLHSLAKKIGLTFKRYRLVPYGNHSYIESLENKSKDLPLYCMGGIRYILDHRFDFAMVAFLDCLQQFKEKVESGDASFHLPYVMEKGKIIDKSTGKCYSIKIQFNSEEQWTKALKFMLTNLKWALAWVSTQFHETISADFENKFPPPFTENFSSQLQEDLLSQMQNSQD